MSDFVHLHLHSEYSLLDGACRIKDIPAVAKANGHDAVAITDHGAMYGAIEFYNACKNEGIKPIIGCEVYVAERSRFDKLAGTKPSHLVLLCKDMTGYQNLIYMVSKGFTEGFYGKPRVDMELLREHHEGLIAMSACLSGKVSRLLLDGSYVEAREYALEMQALFGEENFYIEIQNHGLSDQMRILPSLKRLSEETGIPMVATNDCHYLRRSDARTQATLVCIQTNNVITDGRPIGFETDEFYYKSSDEMRMLFGKYEGALENTVRIAEKCNVEFEFDKLCLPTFPCPKGTTPTEHLRTLAYDGFEKKIADGKIIFDCHTKEEYESRIEYELSVIDKMGYSEYFLIVQDYVMYAKNNGISVGPGRGSGAGSLVAFIIGITDIDSIKFDLLFERFLNPERVSMPDIDIDFCYRRRDEVIKYVSEKYGEDHVSQIITFGTLAAKAAVRDVGRALGMPYSEVDVVAKAIPRELGITLEDALKAPDFKELYDSSDKVKNLVDIAMAIEGMPRNMSVHAAGVVITDKPTADYVPLAVSNETVVTQYDMDTVAKLGILKFDFLALRYLTIIQDACFQIKEKEPDFDIERVSLDDEKTYKLISRGDTEGIFQLESGGMRQMLTEFKPRSIDDILAAIALYRPGPMDSIPKYIENRNAPEKIEYATPLLKPILESTYGCIVYQEQVMNIFRQLAGYTYGHADIVRRAMSKKKASVMEAERKSFIDGAAEKGIDEHTATALFDDMASFANYAFNKSHAAAYAVISYRTAYLKAHYPREYFSALLTSVLDSQGKMAEYIADCERRAIHVLPPDINESSIYFNVSGNNIRFGLVALKNVGKQFAANIVEERKKSPFGSFEDFVERMSGRELNKRQVETLIKSGAFDSLGVYRSRLLASYDKMIEGMSNRGRGNLDGQLDMFSAIPSDDVMRRSTAFEYPMIAEFSTRELLMQEKEASGMYFSGHLLDSYSKNISDLDIIPLSEFALDENGDSKFSDRQRVKIAGVISAVTAKTTKKEERMAFFTLEDKFASLGCIAFPQQYARVSQNIHIDSAVVIEGSVTFRDEDEIQIVVSSVAPLVENSGYVPAEKPAAAEKKETPAAAQKAEKPKRLFLRVPDRESTEFMKAVNLIDIFDGYTQVVFYRMDEKTYFTYSSGIALSDFVMGELKEILGDGNVIYK